MKVDFSSVGAGSSGLELQAISFCPAGERALGGGGATSGWAAGQNVVIWQSVPVLIDGSTATTGTTAVGWMVKAVQTGSGSSAFTLQAYAICAP